MAYTEPGLRSGWEADAPPADTLLRRFVANWAEAHAVPVAVMGGRCLSRPDVAATNLGRPAGFLNNAVLLAPLGDDAPATMAAVDELYASGDAGEVLLFSAWPTPDLRAYGWQLEGHPPVMMRAPGPASVRRPADDLAVEEVRDAAGLWAFEQVLVRGYPLEVSDLRPGCVFDDAVLEDGRLRCWVGWRDGEPVSAASTFVDCGVNDVTLLATLPAHRGHGYGEALMWPATTADPDLPALLLSSDDGRPVYERMGYVALFRFTVWHRAFPGNADPPQT
jgi:GNAT superfamily N-acetyltransferase